MTAVVAPSFSNVKIFNVPEPLNFEGQPGPLALEHGRGPAEPRTQLEDGRVLAEPEQGAVFRCRRDGSQLEVLHGGMRNPQELAFDEWGNLFAGDNNCDKGDKSRLVYVIDGGDSGWRMHYQSGPGSYRGGPWMAEGMWSLDDERHTCLACFIL